MCPTDVEISNEVITFPDLSECHGITTVHWNARSMYYKMDEVIHVLDSSDAEMLCMSETWLNDDVTVEMVSVNGYFILRTDRT